MRKHPEQKHHDRHRGAPENEGFWGQLAAASGVNAIAKGSRRRNHGRLDRRRAMTNSERDELVASLRGWFKAISLAVKPSASCC